jgi:TRAP transporter 4TM/12TM fusion protein
MKRVGFSAEKAGAVEVASSTNGQLTPPVMGAAAFLMIEFVGISYIEVIKHAFLPAIIAYIALVYIVHLEASKAGLEGLKKTVQNTLMRSLMVYTTVICGIIILSGICYYGFGWLKDVGGDFTFWIASAIVLIAYVGLAKYSTKFPELGRSDTIEKLPVPGPIVKAGLYYLLPVAVLIWCLTVERLSPGLSAFYATIFMAIVLLTHKPLKAMFRGESQLGEYFKECRADFTDGMVSGARNMIGIGVATACAGIILGTVTLTGIGLVLAEFVEFISAGNLILMLIFTAAISLILGMGLPTTANYIVVSSLMAPVIVSVGASNGLIVPLIAVHLFVFYFGILADDTPPVGLAAYAAAAISGGDPIKTGVQGFMYDIRTGVLPFMFIFNTELLLIGITGPIHLFVVVSSALVAMLLFAAATQGYFITHSKKWETVALLLITFTLFRPGFFMDMIYDPLVKVGATRIYEVAEEQPKNGLLRVHVMGETLEGDVVDKVVMLPVGAPGPGKERIETAAGLELREEGGKMFVDNIVFGSAADKQKIDFDWEVVDVQKKADTPNKRWFYIPAILLLMLVWKTQTTRRDKDKMIPVEA